MNSEIFSAAIKWASKEVHALIDSFDMNDGQVAPQAKSEYDSGKHFSSRHEFAESYVVGTKDVIRWRRYGGVEICKEEIREAGTHVDYEDWSKAFSHFFQSAKGGCVAALCEVGKLYNLGLGVDRDMAGGLALLAKAAMCGSSDAAKALQFGGFGLDNIEGWLNDKNMPLLKEAERLGLPWAVFTHGSMYFFGLNGTPRDEVKGIELIDAAASKGFWLAKRHLALCYFDGVGGVKQDVLLALHKLVGLSRGHRQSCLELMMDRLYLWKTDTFKWSEKHAELAYSGLDVAKFKKIICESAREYCRLNDVAWIHVIDTSNKEKILKGFGYNYGLGANEPEGYLFVGKIGLFGVKGAIIYDECVSFTTKDGTSYITLDDFLLLPTDKLEELWDNFDIKSLGATREEITDFIDYLKRSILLCRRAGKIRLDGTKQRAVQMQRPDGTIDETMFVSPIRNANNPLAHEGCNRKSIDPLGSDMFTVKVPVKALVLGWASYKTEAEALDADWDTIIDAESNRNVVRLMVLDVDHDSEIEVCDSQDHVVYSTRGGDCRRVDIPMPPALSADDEAHQRRVLANIKMEDQHCSEHYFPVDSGSAEIVCVTSEQCGMGWIKIRVTGRFDPAKLLIVGNGKDGVIAKYEDESYTFDEAFSIDANDEEEIAAYILEGKERTELEPA